MGQANRGTPAHRWSVITASVPGASHARTGLPNQDAVGHSAGAQAPGPAPGEPLVLALADGHGSPHCFRSDVGSRIAVDVALHTLSRFLRDRHDLPGGEVDREAPRLPAELVERWLEQVGRHLAEHPFASEEIALLRAKTEAPADADALRATPAELPDGAAALAYGSTLLAVALTDGFALFLQLGDGDILLVPDGEGEPQPALPPDPALIANETTSLCMPQAQRHFRYRFLALDDAAPRLILASTDGYPNSFQDDADFRKVGSDLRNTLRTDGMAPVAQALPGWLSDASLEGSGDDATLGLLWRLDPAPIAEDAVPPAAQACPGEPAP